MTFGSFGYVSMSSRTRIGGSSSCRIARSYRTRRVIPVFERKQIFVSSNIFFSFRSTCARSKTHVQIELLEQIQIVIRNFRNRTFDQEKHSIEKSKTNILLGNLLELGSFSERFFFDESSSFLPKISSTFLCRLTAFDI